MSPSKIVAELEVNSESSHLSKQIALQSKKIVKLEDKLVRANKRVKCLETDRDNQLILIAEMQNRYFRGEYTREVEAKVYELDDRLTALDVINRKLEAEKMALELQVGSLLDEVSRLKEELTTLRLQVP
jgi:chromosome segregation ATPase